MSTHQIFYSAKKNSPSAIVGFAGRYHWLSNYSLSNITHDGLVYSSVAHAFLAAGLVDVKLREEIANCGSWAFVKRLAEGKERNYVQEMETTRVDLLATFLLQKFEPREMRTRLKTTGDALLVNKVDDGDVIWGVCNNRGYNLLGQLLMATRTRLIELDSMKLNRGSK